MSAPLVNYSEIIVAALGRARLLFPSDLTEQASWVQRQVNRARHGVEPEPAPSWVTSEEWNDAGETAAKSMSGGQR